MSYDRSFRFASHELNRRLIAQLRGAGVDFAVRPDGGIGYRSEDEPRFEDALSQVRGSVFPDWQVLSFPPNWADRYRDVMSVRGVGYEEEVSDGAVEFLLAGHHDPHAWDVG